MSKFVTTIQLLDADKKDYDILFRALEKESFKNEDHETKTGAYVTGKEVFSLNGDITLQDINNAVFRASSKTGKRYSFFVIKHKKVA